MALTDFIDEKKGLTLPRFPSKVRPLAADTENPAIRLYGRRLYKDQAPVEYLAEFLLAFASPKVDSVAEGQSDLAGSFTVPDGTDPAYYPNDRVALKLFSFFASSKLETRHPALKDQYLKSLDIVGQHVDATSDDDRQETIRLLQSLFAGFVGVAKNRTWVTYTFLPASSSLLAREISWLHTDAKAKKYGEVKDWDSAQNYLDTNTRNFMGRGGELLFLQLANLFANDRTASPLSTYADYQHLGLDLPDLARSVETGLKNVLSGGIGRVDHLSSFLEDALSEFRLRQKSAASHFGWVPTVTTPEAHLFAWEMANIVSSEISPLERLDLLQTLCSMHVLRSLCFQGCRIVQSSGKTAGFCGDYAWVASDPSAGSDDGLRQLARQSFARVEHLLYSAIHQPALAAGVDRPQSKLEKAIDNAHDNTHKFFKKLAKELGLVVPKTGVGARFVLDQAMIRFLVAALVGPTERIRLTEFYRRMFTHYGIATCGRWLNEAGSWTSDEAGSEYLSAGAGNRWVEENLKQGGFLIELSDAVSIVINGMSRKAAE